MIPISNELREAVINEVMPKNMEIKESRTLFAESVELLNWYSNSGSAGESMYSVSAPSFYESQWFWIGSSGTPGYDVVNTYFGKVRYVYFVFEMRPETPTNETLNLQISTNFGVDTFVNNFEFVNDGKHKFGYRIDGNVANYITQQYALTEINITNITSGYTVFIGNPQIFLSDRELEFDDIPDNFDLYATEQNIETYIPKYIPHPLQSLDIEIFNWYKESPSYGSVTGQTTVIPPNGEIKFSSDIFNLSQVNSDYFGSAKYLSFSCWAYFDNSNNVVSGDVFSIRVSFKRSNGSYYIEDSPNYQVSHFVNNAPSSIREERIYIEPILVHRNGVGDFQYFYEIWLRNTSTTTPIVMNEYGFLCFKPMIRLENNYKANPNYTELWASEENIEQETQTALDPITNDNIISQSFIYKESICSADNLKFGLCEAAEIQVDVFDKNYDFIGMPLEVSLQFADIEEKFIWDNFVVAEAKKSYAGDVQKRHLVAYDALTKLNENAYSWYTQYMWGINLDRSETYYPYMFDYGRQIFSTYFNLAKSFGIDDESSFEPIETTTQNVNWQLDRYFTFATNRQLRFGRNTISKANLNDCDAFMVFPNLKNGYESGTQYQYYLANYDSLGRGVNSANVLLEFTVSGQSQTTNYLCDSGDLIIPPANWTSVDICTVFQFLSGHYDTEDVCLTFDVKTLNFKQYDATKIVNATEWLPYYSFVWRKPTLDDIFKADSSITARDVMRSLMEMCGCFFRLDRSGKPQFLYAMEHGLYPSNTLFPADDLFPKKSSEMVMPTSYYLRAEFEEYRVSNFGGVQVVVSAKDNYGTVCRWEYWGDDSSDNAYIIDDNIFLCSSQFEYEPQMAGNVEELLENLWGVLNNMSYTPFTAEAIGTPFLESGDRFTLLTKNDGFESFIFERTLKGIQALKDTYEARGKNTPRVKTFEWNN